MCNIRNYMPGCFILPAEPCNREANPVVQGGVLFVALLLPTSANAARQVDRCKSGRSANHKEKLFRTPLIDCRFNYSYHEQSRMILFNFVRHSLFLLEKEDHQNNRQHRQTRHHRQRIREIPLRPLLFRA